MLCWWIWLGALDKRQAGCRQEGGLCASPPHLDNKSIVIVIQYRTAALLFLPRLPSRGSLEQV